MDAFQLACTVRELRSCCFPDYCKSWQAALLSSAPLQGQHHPTAKPDTSPPPKRPRSIRGTNPTGNTRGHKGLQRGVGCQIWRSQKKNNRLKNGESRIINSGIRFQIADIPCRCRNIWSSKACKQGAQAVSALSLWADPNTRSLSRCGHPSIPPPLSAPRAGRREGKNFRGKQQKENKEQQQQEPSQPSPKPAGQENGAP